MKLDSNHFIVGLAAALAFGAGSCASGKDYTEKAGTAADVLNDDYKIAAHLEGKSGGVVNDFAGRTSATAMHAFTITRNDKDGVDIKVRDQSASFASTDAAYEGTGWEKRDGTKEQGLRSWNGKTAAVLDPASPDYSQIWEYYLYDSATGQQLAGFTTTGTVVREETLKTLPKATFEGYMAARTWNKTNPYEQRQYEAGTDTAKGIYGAGYTGVTITADFATGAVEGEIMGLTAAWNDGAGGPMGPATAQAGSIRMNATKIFGNGSGQYEDKLIGENGFMDLGDSVYRGDFYGPGAEETAGVIAIDTPTQAGSGAFRALKQ